MKFEKCVLEIGANDGRDSCKLYEKYKLPVLAVEPTPFLLQKLWSMYGHNKNIHVLPFAIDLESGIKKFNIAGHADWGCSSLHEFTKNIQEIWPGRPDFVFNDFCHVCCITGMQLCEMFGIEHIEYLWLDAQGNDFNVLKSFGDKITAIKSGNCEAAYQTDLYQANNRYDDIVDYLHSYEFETIVVPDALNKKECDIFFERTEK